MANLMDIRILDTIKHGFESSFANPGIDVQIYLITLAVFIAFAANILAQKLLQRKLAFFTRHVWFTKILLPIMLLPMLITSSMVVAAWIAGFVLHLKPVLIAAVLKMAIVWLGARILLLISQRHFIAYFVNIVMLLITLLSVTNLLGVASSTLTEISFDAGTVHITLLGILKGIFAMVVLFWGAGVISESIERWLRRTKFSFNARELIIKFSRIALYFIAFVMTLDEMGVDMTALTVFGGAFAVGLGFGFQKITSNFISGIILLFENTIQAGDLIEVGTERGWVRRLAIRHTQIESPDGRDILIPNEDLITGKVINWTYTSTRARIDINLTVTFDSNAELIQRLLIEAARNEPLCLAIPAPECFLKEFNERGIQFMLIFWINDVKSGMSVARSNVMLQIVKAFRENAITFARV